VQGNFPLLTGMKIHRHIRTSVLVSAAAAVVALAVILLIEYRTGKIVKLLVEQQSQGEFSIQIAEIDFSLFRHQLELESVVLRQIDTSTARTKAMLQLPHLFLRITSWSHLLFEKKLEIDSVMLRAPVFETSVDTGARRVDISFQAAEIIKGLNKAVAVLNVRALRLEDGTLLLHTANAGPPFQIRHINVSIRNFGQAENAGDRLHATGELELEIGEQQWNINDLMMGFHRLHFNGSSQSLDMDSFRFASAASENRSHAAGSVDRIYFESDSLSRFFESGELILDTLLCVRPVVQVYLAARPDSVTESTAVAGVLRNLFPDVFVHHLSVTGGQIFAESSHNAKSLTYATKQTDLQIGDLNFRPGEDRYLTVGDIGLQLRQITFYTPDSLYQLNVEEFDLYNSEIAFRNALFKPATGHAPSFLVAIPVLSLHRFSLQDLLQGSLGAERAVMNNAVVTIAATGGVQNEKRGKKRRDDFYYALQGLSEVLRVRTLDLNNATIRYRVAGTGSLEVTMNEFNSSVQLNRFLQSASAREIKHSFTFFQIGQIDIHSKSINAAITDFHLRGTEQHNGIGHIRFTAPGVNLNADDFYWHHLLYDSLLSKRKIIADSIHAANLALQMTQAAKSGTATPRDFPFLQLRMAALDKFTLHYSFRDHSEFSAKGKDYLLADLTTSERSINWRDASGEFTSVKYRSEMVSASADKLNFHSPGKSKFKDIKISWSDGTSSVTAKIPEMKLLSEITNTNPEIIRLQSLNMDKPQVKIAMKQAPGGSSQQLRFPVELFADAFRISDGTLQTLIINGSDSLTVTTSVNLQADSLHFSKKEDLPASFANADLVLSTATITNRKTEADVPLVRLSLNNGKFLKNQQDAMFQSTVHAAWSRASVKLNAPNDAHLHASELTGELRPSLLQLNRGSKQDWISWLDRLTLSDGQMRWRDSATTITFRNTVWDGALHNLHVDSFQLQPNLTEEDHFFFTTWQSDYIRATAAGIDITGIDPQAWLRDSLFHVHRIDIEHAGIDVTRDKRHPFFHGTEKQMPTQMLGTVKQRFRIDSIVFRNSRVAYNEYSNLTNRKGIVPIENINATLKNLTNDHIDITDTLALKGKGQIYNSHISKFSYKEVYDDSLSAFSLTVKISPTELREFSRMTEPLAAVEVTSGKFDTLLARISGNKYASVGAMRFDYRDLKVQLLNPEDTLSKRLGLSFVNFVANSFVIKSGNKKPSTIFFMRDRERFVFNYWMKSILSGVLTSAGIKRNGKYENQYRKMKKQYPLPPADF
jgi:hypothetical protein